jgi:bifunctional polynucleotide phosphatase/kinase
VKEGYRVVVFTNQGGVEFGHTGVDTLKTKFQAIHEKLGIPILFLGATHDDKYRKPRTGMWDYFE